MKVAVLGDTHFGVRNDLSSIAEEQRRYFKDEFFPDLKKRGITTIVQMGDLFDRRQFLTLKTMEHFEQSFYKLLEEYDIHMYMLLGNHDVLYKDTNIINSPDLYLANHTRITVINTPESILDNKILMVPWINKENYDDTIDSIKNNNSPYCFGHFELAGFSIQKGTIAQDGGLPVDNLFKFDKVLSGHYHTISHKGNITYTGVPYEMTWNQFDDTTGYWEFDTDNGEMEHVKNTEAMFFKVEYDSKDDSRSWIPYKPENLHGKFIKVIVTIKDSHYKFDKWLKKIQSYEPYDLQIFDNNVSIDGVDFDVDNISEGLSNIEIINTKIDNMNDDVYNNINKKLIKEKIDYLYSNIEV